MSLRMGLRPLLVCSALMAFSQAGFGQVKVAVINMQKAVFDSAEINKANLEMQATFKPRQDKINQLQNELQAIADQLQKGGDKLSQQQQSDLQYTGQKKQRELKNLQDDLTADSEAYRNEVLQKTRAENGRCGEEALRRQRHRPGSGGFDDSLFQADAGFDRRGYRGLRQSVSGEAGGSTRGKIVCYWGGNGRLSRSIRRRRCAAREDH